MSGEPKVMVSASRHFDATAEQVFDAWIDPDKVRNWMKACGSMANLSRVEVDPRVGGSFAFVDVRDGEEVEHVGDYLEIDRPRRLVFTWRVKPEEESSKVSIDIVSLRAGCEATLTHELAPEWADFADRCQAAWAKMLGGIAAILD